MTEALPPGPLLAYYGDDFTGSAAVMEVMSFAGLDSVMFLGPPSAERLAAFADRRCIGIAGIARSKPPEWMDEHLPSIYGALAGICAPLIHYKVCSTFDSAPQIGSIGRAIDLGMATLAPTFVPLVVAAPAIGRYQLFGHLFAAVAGVGHRLDRHPVMAHHPVTPMNEADLTRHLARQTDRRIGLIDLPTLQGSKPQAALAAIQGDDRPIIMIDGVDEASLAAAGRLIWENRRACGFVAGSQGIEYALVAHWRAAGLIPRSPAALRVAAVERIAVVSGSCSPVTAGQIAHAQAHGFAGIRLDASRAVDPAAWETECGRAVQAALDALGQGASPLVFTAQGPDDPAVPALTDACHSAGLEMAEVNDRIGAGLGEILGAILDRSGLSRALIAGGDTSGHATLALGVDALSAIAEIAPGSPLCRAHADDSSRDRLELALKGGQIGGIDYFSAVRAGGPIGTT
ncbi:MAG: type III effector [Hyphomicrobiales bacterium]|nr:MAG: type III effector [Hyphomicrobiales bacterium]